MLNDGRRQLELRRGENSGLTVALTISHVYSIGAKILLREVIESGGAAF
jgi:hypothetical protein